LVDAVLFDTVLFDTVLFDTVLFDTVLFDAVLFDAVGTLIRPDPPVAAAYEGAGRRYGSRLTRDEVSERFHRSFAAQERVDDAAHDYRTDEARERNRWHAIVAEVFDDVFARDPQAGESLFAELWDHFARPESWRLFDDAGAAVRRLVDSGVTVGVASNFDARLPRVIEALLPEIPGDRVFASSLVGWKKPSPRFFRECELRLGRSAGEMTLVGDDDFNDFQAAAAAGWRGVLIDRDGTPSGDGTRIAGLEELFRSPA
jgi:putative hydrolase of the HAD superfamily